MERWEALLAASGARARKKKARIIRYEKLYDGHKRTAHDRKGPMVERCEEKPLYLVQVREMCLCFID